MCRFGLRGDKRPLSLCLAGGQKNIGSIGVFDTERVFN